MGNFDLGEEQLVQLDGSADVGLRAGAALPAGEVLQLVLLPAASRDVNVETTAATAALEQQLELVQWVWMQAVLRTSMLGLTGDLNH